MIDILVHLLVVLVVAGLIWYLIGLLPLPEPFGQIARIVFVVIVILVVIGLLYPVGTLRHFVR